MFLWEWKEGCLVTCGCGYWNGMKSAKYSTGMEWGLMLKASDGQIVVYLMQRGGGVLCIPGQMVVAIRALGLAECQFVCECKSFHWRRVELLRYMYRYTAWLQPISIGQW